MKLSAVAFLFAVVLFTGCSKDDPAPVAVVNNAGPVAPTTALRSGTLVAENATPTMGSVSIIRDANNDEWVSLGANFTSTFATGTVTAYLAKSAARIGDQRTLPPPPVPNVLAVGFVSANGAKFLKITGASATFSHVVLYCETAEVNFGNAPLN